MSNDLARRRMLQYLQSLERAGITHMPRCSAETAAEIKSQAAAEARAAIPSAASAATSLGPASSPRRATSEASQSSSAAAERTVGSQARGTTSEASTSIASTSQAPSSSAPIPPGDPSSSAGLNDRSRSAAVARSFNAEFKIETPQLSREEKIAALAELNKLIVPCVRCQELAGSRKQTVFGSGNPDARLVFVGEAPGADEDRLGQPFVGRAGQKLTEIIERGMKITREDVYICNVLKCRPPGNRTPLPDEVANCRGFLERQLEIIRPEFICCLGTTASKTLLNTSLSMGRLRGRLHRYTDIPVVCTYHPSYILKYPEYRKEVWEDIQFLLREMGMLPKG